MRKAGILGSVALAVVIVPLLSGFAVAQTTPIEQIYDWTPASVAATPTSMEGWNGYACVAGERNSGYAVSQLLTLRWTDTTAAMATRVRIQLTFSWSYVYPNAVFPVSVNGVSQGNFSPTGYTTYQCTAGTAGSSSVTYESGLTTFNSSALNTIEITSPTVTGYHGVCPSGTNNFYIRAVITKLNTEPGAPANAVQIGPDGKTIPVGGICSGSTVRLRATVTDPDNDDVALEAEFQPISFFFQQVPNYVGNAAPSGQDAIVDITNIQPGSYHWAVRAVDPFEVTSGWVSFGNNSEITVDVVVDSAVKPPAPIDSKNHGGGDCDISVGVAGGLLSPALLGLALLGFGLGGRRR